MNVAAHRSMVMASPPPPAPPPTDPEPIEPDPDGPGPKPPPKFISSRALMALVSQRPTSQAPCEARPVRPGPLDPYVRKALDRTGFVAGGDPRAAAVLNPQPLPPRSAFLAAVIMEFTERMTAVAELADLVPRPGGEPGNIIAAGHVARFVDEVCDSGARMRWPFPYPEPPWYADSLGGADLIVMGTQFQQSAVIALDRDLGRTFADAAHALLEAGAARLV